MTTASLEGLILSKKILAGLVAVILLIGLLWWFIDYSANMEDCRRHVQFFGTSASGFFGLDMPHGSGIKYESRDAAVSACMDLNY